MVKLFWDRGDLRAQGRSGFVPDEYEEALGRVCQLTGVELAFHPERDQTRGAGYSVPIRLENSRTGWAVACETADDRSVRATEAAAGIIGRIFTAEQDISTLATEVADRHEELNFLYDMSSHVGALLDEDEICDFVVKEAAWLMNCERASIMVADQVTGDLRIRASVGLPEDLPEDVTVRPGQGISGKVFATGHGIIVNEGDPLPADSLKVRDLREANCFLSVPLKISGQGEERDRVLGVFNLTRKRQSNMFSASDLKLVTAVAGTAATQIHNCRLINAERQRRELEHELQLAAKIQLGLLPEEPLRVGSVEVGGYCKPARHVGGDLFDYWLMDDHVCLIIADVSGHDIGAALMATAFRSVVRSESAHRRSVEGLVSQVNRGLFNDLVHSELFVSAFYAEIELGTGIATFCRAGHPKPLLIELGTKAWLDTEGFLLGIMEDGQFEQRTVQLNRGDTIVLYTDGLVEAQSPEHVHFGADGVERAALKHIALAPKEMAIGIVDSACEYCGEGSIMDDMTALVVRYGDAERK